MVSLRVGCLLLCLSIALATPEEQRSASEEQCSLLQTRRFAPQGTLNSSVPAIAKTFVIKNSCKKSIFVRKGPLDKDDSCPNGRCTPEQTIEPGGSKTWESYVPRGPYHNSIVLSWGDYHNFCVGATFCTQLEANEEWQMNFAHQRGFSMDVGVAFYKGGYPGGTIPSHCPEPAFSPPSWPEASLKTNAGRMDTCKWDVKRDCPESAFLVATSGRAVLEGGPLYCVSPDQNLAVISELMDNPTEDECAKPAPPPATSNFGTPPRHLCERRADVANTMTLSPPNELWDATGSGLGDGLFPGSFTHPSDKRKRGGAKDYQHAVNKGCSNQPPTQRVEWADDSKTRIKLNEGFQAQGGTIPEGSDEKYLDHGVSYEGDDVHYFTVDGKKAYFTRDTGIKCPPGDYDTVVLEACPA